MSELIVRIAEGMGNQLFMYANAYSFSKKLNKLLYVDKYSGYFKKKNQFRSYLLDNLNISAKNCSYKDRFDNFFLDNKRKILKKIDKFKTSKRFLIEKRFKNKKTKFYDYTKINYHNKIFVEGYFQSEKYFINYRNDLLNEFNLRNEKLYQSNKYINLLNSTNSVSICIRNNRYSEGRIVDNMKSNIFTKNTISFINKSVDFFKSKIDSPKFFIWSDDFSNLNNYFDQKIFVFVDNSNDKTLNDFHLFKYSKHFIVGPTPFHWWGAWLNDKPEKICVRPSNLNPSNNQDFWPDKWVVL